MADVTGTSTGVENWVEYVALSVQRAIDDFDLDDNHPDHGINPCNHRLVEHTIAITPRGRMVAEAAIQATCLLLEREFTRMELEPEPS